MEIEEEDHEDDKEEKKEETTKKVVTKGKTKTPIYAYCVGGVAVDEHFDEKDCFIYSDGKQTYAKTLNQSNLQRNNNKVKHF